MKELSICKQKSLYGGNISATIYNGIVKGLTIFTDIGRYLGSSIRRIFDGNLCDY